MKSYDFFLFSKIFDLIIKSDLEYDILYQITIEWYNKFDDIESYYDMNLYDAIVEYITENKQAIIEYKPIK